MRRTATLLLALATFVTATPAHAAVPLQMPLQGVLRDGAGMPAPDGAYEVVFSIYEAATGSEALWTEARHSQGASKRHRP